MYFFYMPDGAARLGSRHRCFSVFVMLYIIAFFGFIAFSIICRVAVMLIVGSREAMRYIVMWLGLLGSWAIMLFMLAAFALTSLAG